MHLLTLSGRKARILHKTHRRSAGNNGEVTRNNTKFNGITGFTGFTGLADLHRVLCRNLRKKVDKKHGLAGFNLTPFGQKWTTFLAKSGHIRDAMLPEFNLRTELRVARSVRRLNPQHR